MTETLRRAPRFRTLRVASDTLFDISQIDLDHIEISAEEVARINPHRGDMRHLDHVIWVDAGKSKILGVKHVREDEFWVPGHIPGRPLLPGVLMIEAAAQLSSVCFKLRTGDRAPFLAFTRIGDVVFRTQVVPGDTLYLLAREEKYQPRRFISRVQGIVDGETAFEATISGMLVKDDQGRSGVSA